MNTLKKSIVILLLIVPFTWGTSYIELSGGISSPSTPKDAYAAGTQYQCNVQWRRPGWGGWGFETGIGYLKHAHKTSETKDFTTIPITLGLTYLFVRNEAVSPYVGVRGTVNFLDNDFDSPTVGASARAGVRMKMNKTLNLFLEGETQSFAIKKTGIDDTFNTMIVRAGIEIALTTPKRHKKPKTKKMLKNRQPKNMPGFNKKGYRRPRN